MTYPAVTGRALGPATPFVVPLIGQPVPAAILRRPLPPGRHPATSPGTAGPVGACARLPGFLRRRPATGSGSAPAPAAAHWAEGDAPLVVSAFDPREDILWLRFAGRRPRLRLSKDDGMRRIRLFADGRLIAVIHACAPGFGAGNLATATAAPGSRGSRRSAPPGESKPIALCARLAAARGLLPG